MFSTLEAAKSIAAGALVAYPTETSWGLGADARSEAALESLRAFKGRDRAKPLSVLVEGVAALEALGAKLDASAKRLAQAHWPGPLTLVLPCTPLAPALGGAGGGVGFRCSPHPVAQALAAAARRLEVGPVTATSLNLAGEAACTSYAEALQLTRSNKAAKVALLEGVDAFGLAPSTVVDATGSKPRILRVGALPCAEIARTLGDGPAA